MDQALITAEALRVYRRYAVEIVEAYNLCPWAARARKEGRVREQVLLQETPDVEGVLSAVDDIAGDLSVEVALFIFPRLDLDRLMFQRFHARVREADAQRYEFRASPLASAAFHPEAEANLANPDTLKPFIRRTPDPTIQWVRLSVLEALRGDRPAGTIVLDPQTLDLEALKSMSTESMADAVARTNLKIVEDVGVAELEAKLDDIRRDRNAAYGIQR